MRITDLKYLFMPHYWIMNQKLNKQWDEKLNKLLDEFDVEELTGFTCVVGGVKVWISNYPYSFGMPYLTVHREYSFRPRRRTIERLKKRVDKFRKNILSQILTKFVTNNKRKSS